MMAQWVAVLLDRLTALIGALAGFLVALGALWQAIGAKRQVRAIRRMTDGRLEILERRSGVDRRKADRGSQNGVVVVMPPEPGPPEQTS